MWLTCTIQKPRNYMLSANCVVFELNSDFSPFPSSSSVEQLQLWLSIGSPHNSQSYNSILLGCCNFHFSLAFDAVKDGGQWPFLCPALVYGSWCKMEAAYLKIKRCYCACTNSDNAAAPAAAAASAAAPPAADDCWLLIIILKIYR